MRIQAARKASSGNPQTLEEARVFVADRTSAMGLV
jgi:hypothetical protein